MGILAKIKNRPENEKRVFSLVSAIVLTLVIVFVWLSFGNEEAPKEVAVKESKLSSISPIQVIKDEFSKAFNGFGDEASQVLGTTTESEVVALNESTSTVGSASTTVNAKTATTTGIATTTVVTATATVKTATSTKATTTKSVN
jgi:hypothetical protein